MYEALKKKFNTNCFEYLKRVKYFLYNCVIVHLQSPSLLP